MAQPFLFYRVNDNLVRIYTSVPGSQAVSVGPPPAGWNGPSFVRNGYVYLLNRFNGSELVRWLPSSSTTLDHVAFFPRGVQGLFPLEDVLIAIGDGSSGNGLAAWRLPLP
jgi:hypothetical protein